MVLPARGSGKEFVLLLHSQGGESSYFLALEGPWSQCFAGQCCRAEEAGFTLAAGLGRAVSRKHGLVAWGLGVSHGTRLVFPPQCSMNADSCCHLYVSGAGLVQELPL